MNTPNLTTDPQASNAAAVLPFAGFWIRWIAALIDFAVLGLTCLLGALVLFRLESWGTLPQSVVAVAVQIFWLGPILYFIVLEAAPMQGTVGKYVLGLQVTSRDGHRISVGQSIGRTFSKLLSYFIWGIGFLMVAFTARKQGLHDKLADTLVLRATGGVAGSPGKPGLLVRAFRGEASLGGVFWGIGVVGLGLLFAAFWGLMATWDSASAYRNGMWMPSATRDMVRGFAERYVYVVAGAYILWHVYVSISVWRCAKNARSALWRELARIAVVLSWAGEAAALVVGFALSGLH